MSADRQKPRPTSGLGSRLFAAQALIVLVGAVTMIVAAVMVAPGLFHTHLERALGTVSDEMALHIDRAFETSMILALGVAILASLLMTMAVSWFLTRRITRPVRELAEAAERVAAGAYDTAVPHSGLGAEFDRLNSAFNAMADQLARTERRRKDLLADLAHELRTPLATLDGFLEGLQDGVLPTDEETWATMREQTARLTRLVQDVNAVSAAEERRLAPSGEPVDVTALVAESARAAEPHYRTKGVALEVHATDAEALVAGDPDRLREVFDNLVTNALRHTPGGGHVTVGVSVDGQQVLVEVDDDGEGIDPRHLPHVFERFFRGDTARRHDTGGSGIGLTIARAIVDAHGGSIMARSDGIGRGACFTVLLPRAR